jgi:branched-subunit amino acid transport protein
LTALVIASLSGRDEQMSIGIVAAIAAAGISWRVRRTWACIVGGMLTYWLLVLAF